MPTSKPWIEPAVGDVLVTAAGERRLVLSVETLELRYQLEPEKDLLTYTLLLAGFTASEVAEIVGRSKALVQTVSYNKGCRARSCGLSRWYNAARTEIAAGGRYERDSMIYEAERKATPHSSLAVLAARAVRERADALARVAELEEQIAVIRQVVNGTLVGKLRVEGPDFERGQRVAYRGPESGIGGMAGVVQAVLSGRGLDVLLDSGRQVIRPARDWRPEDTAGQEPVLDAG